MDTSLTLANRSPLKRRSRLQRKTRLRARRRTQRRSGRVRDTSYMLWVKTLPCLADGVGDHVCDGSPIEAHHAGRRAMGRKADDNTCIPLCQRAHREWHSATGIFRMGKDERRLWAECAIAVTQARYMETQLRAAV